MSAGSVFKNIITFGASGRIDSEIEVYESFLSKLKDLNTKMEEKKKIVNNLLITVVDTKKRAVNSLKKIRQLTKNLKSKDRQFEVTQFGGQSEQIKLAYVENSLELATTALNASKGVGAGIATASSVYFLVGQMAAASTGTAITALSGAAATNATLAWLGGGSIAAGGGGMAAGTAVLGGLVAIPALAIMGLFSHLSANKKIKEIKEKEIEALKLMDDVEKNLLAFDLIEKRAKEIEISVQKSHSAFENEFKRTYKKIYPVPIISSLIKKLRKIFGFNYFNTKDLKEVHYITNIAFNFAKIIDTKVIEETQ